PVGHPLDGHRVPFITPLLTCSARRRKELTRRFDRAATVLRSPVIRVERTATNLDRVRVDAAPAKSVFYPTTFDRFRTLVVGDMVNPIIGAPDWFQAIVTRPKMLRKVILPRLRENLLAFPEDAMRPARFRNNFYLPSGEIRR